MASDFVDGIMKQLKSPRAQNFYKKLGEDDKFRHEFDHSLMIGQSDRCQKLIDSCSVFESDYEI